jgi:hypothetical protein
MPDMKLITTTLLRDPVKWPMVTHLCMKKTTERRESGFPKCGIIRESGYRPNRIIVENHPDKTQGEFTEHFDSIESLLAAGWIVD